MACRNDKLASTITKPGYLNDMPKALQANTDMLIVVEGTELPCHKQVLAVHSKVFAGMAELTAGVGRGAQVTAQCCYLASRCLGSSW